MRPTQYQSHEIGLPDEETNHIFIGKCFESLPMLSPCILKRNRQNKRDWTWNLIHKKSVRFSYEASGPLNVGKSFRSLEGKLGGSYFPACVKCLSYMDKSIIIIVVVVKFCRNIVMYNKSPRCKSLHSMTWHTFLYNDCGQPSCPVSALLEGHYICFSL